MISKESNLLGLRGMLFHIYLPALTFHDKDKKILGQFVQCTKFAERTDSTVPACTLDNVVKELHVLSACERLSLHSYICV